VGYPVKTPRQLRPLLVGFRKAAGLTQATMATRLGVTQQTYAQLEAKPESTNLERLFHVLTVLRVNIVLTQVLGSANVKRHAPADPRTTAAPVEVKHGKTKKHATTAARTAGTQKTVKSERADQQGSQKPVKRKRAASTGGASRKREDW
jgi:HTH-type transcriptional regulator / antitoxin HipB